MVLIRSQTWGYMVLLSVLVGIVSGLGTIAFSVLYESGQANLMERVGGYKMPKAGAEGSSETSAPTRPWLLLFLPALGGLAAGVIIYTFAPEAEGHGTDAVIEAFHYKDGAIRKRVPFVKTIASVLTITSGGSAGREGPIGQIGARFGSALGEWLKSSDRERRLLMLTGAGAGIGATFRAPLGGAIFIAEVLYRDSEFESAAVIPSFVASIVAYSIYCSYTHVWGPIFSIPQLGFNHPMELGFYALLGVVCAGVGWVYVRVFYGIRDRFFRPLRVPKHIKPAVGGLAVGVLGWFVPSVLGIGYGWVQMGIDGTLPLMLALAIVPLKIAATGFTIGSGGSGGVFGPSLVVGGMTGVVFAGILHRLLLGMHVETGAFVLVGMAAFFAGVARVPVASLVMVSEMTTGYGLLVPLMLANTVAFLLVPRSVSIYEQQVKSRVDSPAHRDEHFPDILKRITVAEALGRPRSVLTFRESQPLREILEEVAESSQQIFPVVDEDGKLDGAIDFRELRVFLHLNLPMPGLVLARDLCAAKIGVVRPEQTLSEALRLLDLNHVDEVPVADGEGRLLGVLGRRDLSVAYERYIRQVHRGHDPMAAKQAEVPSAA